MFAIDGVKQKVKLLPIVHFDTSIAMNFFMLMNSMAELYCHQVATSIQNQSPLDGSA